jgi:polyisoprenoid-binding protein YceI
MTDTPRNELPAPGDWKVDVSHTEVGFSVRHLGLAKVRGRFTAFDGTVHVADVPEDSSVEVTIEAASIDSRDAGRDGHLRGADFFDVENHPTLTFHSTGVRSSGSDWLVDGELTIKDVTRPVVLEASFEGIGADPWGGSRAAFSAVTEIDREDWGLTWNAALEGGGFLVGKKVKIELEVELVRAVAADDAEDGAQKVA